MTRAYGSTVLLGLLLTDLPVSAANAEPVHVKVYHESGRYGGWPANNGIWSWGDEILVGFSLGYHKDLGPGRHSIDRERPRVAVLARSVDGGLTWKIEEPDAPGFVKPAGDPSDCPGGIDFTHPDFALRARGSFFHYSYDRGRTWKGPFRLPGFDTPGLAARTNYLVNGPDDCILFLSAAKTNGREGRPLCARTTDGGKSWNFLSWISPEPTGFGIMPSAVRLSEEDLLVAVRRREGPRRWITAYKSDDNGANWRFHNTPVPDAGEGNPPCLFELSDGRLCLTYGVRASPYRICAKLSADEGETWSKEIALRIDGANRDIGYTRSVQRPDGRVVTVYYFNDAATGPERYIAATIWDPARPVSR